MPDWTYGTIFRPALSQHRPSVARNIALGFLGGLARLPGGGQLIDLLGHFAPDARLKTSVFGRDYRTRVGLGAGFDPNGLGAPALARFGLGWLELGPLTLRPSLGPELTELGSGRNVWQPRLVPNVGAPSLARSAHALRALGIPIWARLVTVESGAAGATAEACDATRLLRQLADVVTLETLDTALDARWTDDEWSTHARAMTAAAEATPWMVCVSADADARSFALVEAALRAGAAGVLVLARRREARRKPPNEAGWSYGADALPSAIERVREARRLFGPATKISLAGGATTPRQAQSALAAGADLIQLDIGLVFSGPGLPKRINELLLGEDTQGPRSTLPAPRRAWFWGWLMGVAMLLGGGLALGIAATRVVLPYDEHFLGMTRDAVQSVNPRLLSFMRHDRVTLAGTMLSIGTLYVALAWCGIRLGMHWAWKALLLSAGLGFASFFLFLGFGYFDPFHAFVTAVLFQFLLLAWHSPLGVRWNPTLADLDDDGAWRKALWGQLLVVIEGAALLTAGAVISWIGATSVFVPEDLEFLRTTSASLHGAHPRLVPLVAHDRATFGGMLLAVGASTTLMGLWGWRRGQSWVWWSLLVAGGLGYGPAIAVHLLVGYTDPMHLAPAIGGWVLLLAALGLSREYLCAPPSAITPPG